jgi:hypothetical protein
LKINMMITWTLSRMFQLCRFNREKSALLITYLWKVICDKNVSIKACCFLNNEHFNRTRRYNTTKLSMKYDSTYIPWQKYRHFLVFSILYFTLSRYIQIIYRLLIEMTKTIVLKVTHFKWSPLMLLSIYMVIIC